MKNEYMNEQIEGNMIDEENNNYNNDCDQFNNFDDFNDEYEEEENNCENDYNDYNDNNQFNMKDQENIQLKNKIQELNQLLFQKDKELEENRIKNDNQLIKINKTFDRHINEYQKLVDNYTKVQNELNNAKKEIINKNQIIKNLQNNMGINNNNINNNLEDEKLILFINRKIKDIYQNYFKETNNIFNENELLNKDINGKIQILIRNIDFFSNKLINFRNNNINEITKLRNILKNNNNNKNENTSNSIDPQFYIKFINLINIFCNNLPNNINYFNNLPNYSLKDKNDKIYNDILVTFKILTNYIISYLKNSNKNNIISNEFSVEENNKYNEELNKRLKEMSDLLIKSNEYLNKSRQENNDLKKKYNELEVKHNLTIRDISSIENNKDKDKDVDKLIKDLNKKNQQIKSLEHMITRLTKRRKSNTSNIVNMTNKSMLTDTSYYGKIINKKIYNEIRNNQNQSSFYLNTYKFVKDEKNEENLKNFLDKYTNGEYGNGNISKIKENNNKYIINLKDEIEGNENKVINSNFSDDEIDNEQNFNEEEEEKKYLMEGKIHN